MKKINFCSGWTFGREGEAMKPVTLPHDAQILEPRDPAVSDGGHGYFPGGKYVYEKHFSGEGLKGKNAILIFEGVYRNSKVWLNGRQAGGHRYGYSEFTVNLDDLSEDNVLRVEADNSELPNSRWYSGSGIYRPVWLYVWEKQGIPYHGVRITTLSVNPAKIRVETETESEEVQIEILDHDKVIASASGKLCEIEIENAELWSDEHPYLYTCKASAGADTVTEKFGIRTIEWSTAGLFINGKNTLLRGGCVHHDNGVVGAAAYDESEYRRARILKEAGFNAIRSAHNPASRAFLEACDQYGLYVMDEAFDMWYNRKTKYDYGRDFETCWRDDVTRMVQKDFNHPSVIMYSIGNEVAEPHEEKGKKTAREMTDLLHELDPSRPVTIGLNLMILSRAAHGKGLYQDGEISVPEAAGGNKEKNQNASLAFNIMASVIGTGMNKSANSKKVDQLSDDVIRTVDICGYNYASGRYPLEEKQHPERIIFGSETFPQDIFKNWKMVEKYPYIFGDFMWTAWDYLGEAGIGAWSYTGGMPFNRPYPWVLAGAGVIDILGIPDASCRYASTVWGLNDKPVIGVRPLNHPGVRVSKSVWRGTNAIESWAWQNCDGNKAYIEVYTQAPQVELFLNGRSIGKKKTKEYKAVFNAKYEPGELMAVAMNKDNGIVSIHSLFSAEGKKKVSIKPEKETVNEGEVFYVPIEITGENGVVESNSDRLLRVKVDNGELLGFGSANPCTVEKYHTGEFTTYQGRTLAVIRAKQEGEVLIRVTDNLKETLCRVPVVSQ